MRFLLIVSFICNSNESAFAVALIVAWFEYNGKKPTLRTVIATAKTKAIIGFLFILENPLPLFQFVKILIF